MLDEDLSAAQPLAAALQQETGRSCLPVQADITNLTQLSEAEQMVRDSLTRVVRNRGSTRAFDRNRAISFEALSIGLDRATRGIAADILDPPLIVPRSISVEPIKPP